MAWRGRAGQGRARPGVARRGEAGKAWRGLVGRGVAWQGKFLMAENEKLKAPHCVAPKKEPVNMTLFGEMA